MIHFAEANLEERAQILNVMQPSPRNNIKIEKIDQTRVIHSLTMNNRYKWKSSSREEPPYTMYWVHKTRYNDYPNENISFLYIGDKDAQ